MIYVKTRLRKMPKSCTTCPYSNLDVFLTDRVCSIKGNRLCPLELRPSGNLAYGKPTWCPLVETTDFDKK